MAVFIGILRLEFRLHGNESLKDKRRVALSLKQKIRNKFNVSVAETGSADSMDFLNLTVASVCNEKQHLESRLAKCLNMAQAACDEELVYDEIEIFAVE